MFLLTFNESTVIIKIHARFCNSDSNALQIFIYIFQCLFLFESNSNFTFLETAMKDMEKFVKSEDLEFEAIMDKLDTYKMNQNIPDQFLHYVALCCLFPPNRNIIKNWSKHENVFLELAKREGKIGKDHFMQAIVHFFIHKYKKEMSRFAASFMKMCVDQNVLSAKFIIDWYDKTIRLDKNSLLYNKKSEKKLKDLCEDFIQWLKDGETASDNDDTEVSEPVNDEPKEEEDDDDQIKEATKPKEETAQEKRQRELIAK